MNKKKKTNPPLTIFRFLAGSILLVTGITLVLVWWRDVVALFRGIIGMFFALGGLLVLYMIKD